MTIEEIEISGERQEALRKEKEKVKEGKKYEGVCKEFNQEAKKRNSPYRILITCLYPHLCLIERWFFNLFEYRKELNQMYYDKDENKFSFIDGLDNDVFKAIEPILNEIEIKFDVKLKNGEVPTKYKILQNL